MTGKAEAEEQPQGQPQEQPQEQPAAPEPVEDVDAAVKEGRRLVKEGRLEDGVRLLSRALETVTRRYGEEELGADVGPVALAYGRALLASARASSSLFGGAVETTDQQKQQQEQQQEEKKGKQEAAEEKPQEQEAAAARQSAAEDLVVAWEVLEMARVVYERAGNKDELASVLLTSAEVSMEDERFDQAYTDLASAAALHEELGRPRDVAADHSELACCALFMKDTEKGIEHYRKALALMDSCCKAKPEDKDLAAIRQDVAERLSDLEESWEEEKKEAQGMTSDLVAMLGAAIAQSMGGGGAGEAGASSSADAFAAANAGDAAPAPAAGGGAASPDVNVLVPKKKRKVEPSADGGSPKRAKVE